MDRGARWLVGGAVHRRPRGFLLEELDRIAPNNPVAIQAVYNHTYLNSVGLAAAKIDASTPNPQGGTIEKDAAGKPSGLIRGAGGVAFVRRAFRSRRRRPGSPTPASSSAISTRWGSLPGSMPAGVAWVPSTTNPTSSSPTVASSTSACSGPRSGSRQRRRRSTRCCRRSPAKTRSRAMPISTRSAGASRSMGR